MYKVKFIISLVFVTSFLGIGVNKEVGLVLISSSHHNQTLSIRNETVQLALAREDLFDCSIYQTDGNQIHPLEQPLFSIVEEIRLTIDENGDYSRAVWSPDGNSLVFIAPTDDYREIKINDTLSLDDESRLVAVSKNKLILYSPKTDTWDPISNDGANPTWSPDSRTIYYMTGIDMMKFDIDSKTQTSTGLSAANTGVSLLFSQPFPNGLLFAPRQPHAPFEVIGNNILGLNQIEITESDYLLLSPTGKLVAVGYSSYTNGGEIVPAVMVIHRSNGEVIPLMKNCQYSALQAAWSPDGNRIAYPVHLDQPEIRIFDTHTKITDIIIQLDTFDRLNGLSWAPDGKHLAFTKGDGRSIPRSIWIASTDGKSIQYLAEGLLPNWSSDGTHLLYAKPGENRMLDWYMLEMEAE